MRVNFYNLPQYFESLQRLKKLFYRVVFPLELRLINHVVRQPPTPRSPHAQTDTPEDSQKLYSLFAVVVHVGS